MLTSGTSDAGSVQNVIFPWLLSSEAAESWRDDGAREASLNLHNHRVSVKPIVQRIVDSLDESEHRLSSWLSGKLPAIPSPLQDGLHTLYRQAERVCRTPLDFLASLSTAEFHYWLGTQLIQRAPVTSIRGIGEQVLQSAVGPALRFATLNMWGVSYLTRHGLMPERFTRAATLLRAHHPDLVAFQEMWHPATRAVIDGIPHRERVSDGREGNLIGSSGLVILSRYPVVETKFTSFRATAGIERFVRKGILYARIAHPEIGAINVFNVHMISEPESINRAIVSDAVAHSLRDQQVRQLLDEVDRCRRGARISLVLGDFNLDERDPEYRTLERLGLDLFRDHHLSVEPSRMSPNHEAATYTFDPLRNPFADNPSGRRERIDHVWAGSAAPQEFVYQAEIGLDHSPVSDHFAVLGSLREIQEVTQW